MQNNRTSNVFTADGTDINFFYPLTFNSLYKDYIWGGRNLLNFGKKFSESRVAESWEISAHRDGMSIIANGAFSGYTLQDLILSCGEKFIGTLSFKQYGKKFPLLIKLLDANQWLSVQVHPDDAYAHFNENDSGKTEMWYILEARPNSKIIYGLNKAVSKDEFSKLLYEGKIMDCLQHVPVKKGDVVYIPAGTIHAAGEGIVIAEVQQNSNTTYRLYDYGRMNPDGSSRALQIDKALEVTDYTRIIENGIYRGLSYKAQADLTVTSIIADQHFCAELICVQGKALFNSDSRTFTAYVITGGSVNLGWKNGNIIVKSGESVLIPANMGQYEMRGSFTALKAFIGDIRKDIIAPLQNTGYSEQYISANIAGLTHTL